MSYFGMAVEFVNSMNARIEYPYVRIFAKDGLSFAFKICTGSINVVVKV